MVFFLSDELIKDGPAQAGYYDFIQTIMIAYKEGKHIIVISPRNLLILISDANIDETSKIFLRHYQSHGKESMGYLNYFQIIVEIIADSGHSSYRSDLATKQEFRTIHFSRLIDTSTIQRTILLGENGNDSAIYSRMAEYYKFYHALTPFKIVFKPQTGGGSTLHAEYRRIYLDDDEFCLCIVDTDRNAPKASLGNTAKTVVDFHTAQSNEHPNIKCHCFTLEALELENLFPLAFYKHQYSDECYEKTHQRLISLQLCHDDGIFYHDFKKGLRTFGNQSNTTLHDYWYPIISEINVDLFEHDGVHYYLRGFGEQILSNFINYDDSTLFRQLDACARLNPIWLKMGRIISSFVLGSERKVAV